jgi:hypothetical protein
METFLYIIIIIDIAGSKKVLNLPLIRNMISKKGGLMKLNIKYMGGSLNSMN